MPLYHNNKLVPFAKDLRNNMTAEERKLWHLFLKRLPLTVNRQKNIGNYIADFYIHKFNLVIEIDGRQHILPEQRIADEERDKELWAYGITVFRYTNEDVDYKFHAVCEDILIYLGLTSRDLKYPFYPRDNQPKGDPHPSRPYGRDTFPQGKARLCYVSCSVLPDKTTSLFNKNPPKKGDQPYAILRPRKSLPESRQRR